MCVFGVKIIVISNWQYFIFTAYAHLCQNLLSLYFFVFYFHDDDLVMVETYEGQKTNYCIS